MHSGLGADESRSLDCQRTATSSLHDHRKTRRSDQSCTVLQLGRFDLCCPMALLLLLTGAEHD